LTSSCDYGSIDILMATYNGEKYVREQIESVKSQSYRNWRMLVSDDGSSDRTRDIVSSEMNDDARVQWADNRGGHGGSYENFMCLLRQSDSDYSMFCDQDDVWLPNKVEVTLEKMRELEAEFPDAPLMVFTDLEVVDESLNVISESFDRMVEIDPTRVKLTDLLVSAVAPGCTIMLNKRLRVLVNKYRNNGGVRVHDWWVSLVAAGTGHIGYVPLATIRYRQHSNNQIGASKISLVKSILTTSVKSAKTSVLDMMKRADACNGAFGSELSDDDRESLQAFLAIPNSAWPRRVALLMRAGVWKSGLLRKAGQFITVLAMKFPEELMQKGQPE